MTEGADHAPQVVGQQKSMALDHQVKTYLHLHNAVACEADGNTYSLGFGAS